MFAFDQSAVEYVPVECRAAGFLDGIAKVQENYNLFKLISDILCMNPFPTT